MVSLIFASHFDSYHQHADSLRQAFHHMKLLIDLAKNNFMSLY